MLSATTSELCLECARSPRLLSEKEAEAVNGSPETIIDTGVADGAAVTGHWVSMIGLAVDGLATADAIMQALADAIPPSAVKLFADPVQQGLTHGVMLGAMDSAYEVSTGNEIAAPAFEEPESVQATSRRLAAPPSPFKFLGFDALPYDTAVAKFLELKPVTRRVFDALDAKAQQKAFTIAGLGKKSMLKVAQQELARQVAEGADLRDFRRFVEARLESNGWTPKSPSHVETIFRTNVQKAYSAGRLEHMMRPSVLKVRPFWQVVGVGDGPPRERPKHAQNNNRVMRADSPAWKGKIPPWGFNCRHRIRSLPASYDGPVDSDLDGVPDKGFVSTVGGLL
jgi:hypothetical protein